MDSPVTYRDAGVDVKRKTTLLAGLAAVIQRTLGPQASPWGGFAGTLGLPAGTGRIAVTIDGAGTKTVLARRLGRDRVIGADIVAHCANDLAASGAHPLCFVDYIAMPRLDERALQAIVEGMSEACARLEIPLLGGETAEMPGVYTAEAYDVVGAMVGIVDARPAAAPPRAGDAIIGLASTGLHTNGYSLARRLLEGVDLEAHDPDLGTTIAEALMAPHRCYVPALAGLQAEVEVRAAAHITGGGLPGNLSRVLPVGLRARLHGRWPAPPVFSYLQRLGRVSVEEMRRTFNLGVGMALIVAAADRDRALDLLRAHGEEAWPIGEVVEGEQDVVFV